MTEEPGWLEVLATFSENGMEEVGFRVVCRVVDLVWRCETPVQH